jgi:hypothetical protein
VRRIGGGGGSWIGTGAPGTVVGGVHEFVGELMVRFWGFEECKISFHC